MKNEKDVHLIKCINIIINLTKNKEIEIKNNHTIKSLEKEYEFKLKKIKLSIVFKKQLNHKIIFYDKNEHLFILLKQSDNNFLIYNYQTHKIEKVNKDKIINISKNHVYYLDFKKTTSF
ncbi:toxin transporter [Proteus vulgaris]|uniref:hypothetical protein n=1 Tax=Proteus vulgaris TaxID=585 RepID=UPI000E031C24|nr:hypothetical protein [Proteus vulgaris]SUC18645.1 toxin transporter [Proteus vulgaris]